MSNWFDCRQPIQDTDLGYYDEHEIKLESNIFDTDYGCQIDIYYDGTVDDIILHDVGNSTWYSISSYYGTFDNSYMLTPLIHT